MILCNCLWADRAILVLSAKTEYPAVAVGVQREQVKPLHAPMGQLYGVRQSILQKAGWAVVPEPKRKKVKRVNEEAVVPEPSLPSSFFF